MNQKNLRITSLFKKIPLLQNKDRQTWKHTALTLWYTFVIPYLFFWVSAPPLKRFPLVLLQQKVISFFVLHSIICILVWGPAQCRSWLVYRVDLCICSRHQQSVVDSQMAICHQMMLFSIYLSQDCGDKIVLYLTLTLYGLCRGRTFSPLYSPGPYKLDWQKTD